MELEDALLRRRSIRKYKNIKLDDEIINKLLYFAFCAPSACNKMPWELYVIKNEEMLAKVRKASMFTNHNAPLAIIVAGNLNNALPKDLADFWIQDCSSMITHILLEATSLGLGSLWCGLYPQKRPVERIKGLLNLNDNIIPLGIIYVGYADEEKEARSQFDDKKIHIFN